MYPTHAYRDLCDARVQATGIGIQALQKGHLVRLGHDFQRIVRSIQGRIVAPIPGLHAAGLTGAGNRARGPHCLAQCRQAYIIAVGKAGFLARLGAHAHALVDVEAAILDDAVFEYPGLADLVLEIQVCGIHPGRRDQLTEHSGDVVRAEVSRHQQTIFHLG